MRSTYGSGTMLELSTARTTNPFPISASAKRFDSSGESELTKVSMAKTKSGVRPCLTMCSAAAAAPFSPTSSSVDQINVTSRPAKSRPSARTASTSAAQPTRSSKLRAFARVPSRGRYSLGIVIQSPTLISELLRFFRGTRSDVNVHRLFHRACPMRPFESRLIPTCRQLEHPANRIPIGFMNDDNMPEKVFRIASSDNGNKQSPIVFYFLHLVSDLVHMRHKRNPWRLCVWLSIAKMQDQVSVGIGLRILQQSGLQPIENRFANIFFIAACAIRVDQRLKVGDFTVAADRASSYAASAGLRDVQIRLKESLQIPSVTRGNGFSRGHRPHCRNSKLREALRKSVRLGIARYPWQ